MALHYKSTLRLSLEDCAHPDDWLKYVRRRFQITHVRVHKETMYLSFQPMDFDNDNIWEKQLELPLDDSNCGVLNARFKRINDKCAKEVFAAASSNRGVLYDFDGSVRCTEL